MNKLVLVLAACGTTPPHTQRSEPATPPEPPVTAGDAAVDLAKPVDHPPTRGAIEAPHAGPITAIGISPDGAIAISSDELGGLRLWPALDGSREPLVVELPHPKQLAVAPRPDGFMAVVLDDVGGLVVAHLDREGRTRSHATLPAEPRYDGIAMTEHGALAWRADQTIELIGGDGAIQAKLPVEPGQRLIDVAVAGPYALALVDAGSTRKARWITLEPKLVWGAWLPAAATLGDQLAVAPSGKRYATLAHIDAAGKKPPRVDVLDAAKGDVVDTQQVGDISELGFVDDEHLALAEASGIGWLTIKGNKAALTNLPLAGVNPHALLAFGGRRALSSTNGDLVLAEPTELKYLGYGVESPTIAQAGPDGQLLIGVGDTFAMLDKQLRVASEPTLAPSGSTVADARWLGGSDWLVVASTPEGTTRLALADIAHGTSRPVRDKLTIVPVLMYEPSTHLATLSLGDTPEVDRYDPAKHVLEKLSGLPKPKGFEQAELVPVAPALAKGAQLVRVTVRDRPTIQWLDDPAALGKAAATVTIDNASFAGADPAGHVFVWRNTPANSLELAIYAAGKPIGKLPNDGPVALWPEPSGARVIEVGQRTVSLFKLDGTRVWAQELTGTTEALWLTDGAIAIVSAAGIARLDAATGTITSTRCGWRFGLTAKPHPPSPQVEPVCVQLRR
jgi:hypothetical protein